jgi:hypothetical protein
MFKFLRKYNKMLLAVFGVLLMITFLIPQAFNQFSERAAAHSGTVATVGDGESVSAAEWVQYQEEVRILENSLARLPGIDEANKPAQWYLLVREAKAAGVVPVLAVPDTSNPQVRQAMALSGVRDPNVLRQADEHLQGVVQLLRLYMTGDLYSDLRLRSEAERLLHTVSARMVVLKPDPAESSFEPTPQQIEEQMKKYADQLPGEGEHGFGYKLPERAKIEWLTVSADSIRTLVESSPAMDRVEQFRHWKKNPNAATFPPYPAEGVDAEIPEAVRNDLLNQLVKAKAEEIAKAASDPMRLAVLALPQKDGYAVLPENWSATQKSFAQLAGDLRTRFGVDLPAYEARGDKWLTMDELKALPGIGTATTDKITNTPVAFIDLVKAAMEFAGSPTLIIQEGVTGPPLRDAAGNLYLFRITDTDPAHVPASVDEVREQVVNDLKREAEYQRLKETLTSIESEARTAGLIQTALAHDTAVQPTTSVYLWNPQNLEMMVQIMRQYGMPLTSRPSSLPVIDKPGEAGDRETVEAILVRSMQVPADKPAAEIPVEQRIFAVPSDNRLAVLVVEVVSQQPLTREGFERLVDLGAVQQLVSKEEADDERTIDRAFSFDALAKRNNFKFTREGEEEAEDAESGEGAPKETKTAAAG